MVDEDIILLDNDYRIPFTQNLIDSLGNSPSSRTGVTIQNECAVFGASDALVYDVGNLFEKDKITIELEVMFLSYPDANKQCPVFNTSFTQFQNDVPFAIWGNYCSWDSMNYHVLYYNGVPEDKSGSGKYNKIQLNKWYKCKLVWTYSEHKVWCYLDDDYLSKRWNYTTRPSYSSRPTKIYFGMTQNPISGYDRQIYQSCNFKLRNFVLKAE